MDPQLFYVVLAGAVSTLTIIGFIWRAAWWTSDQFKDIRGLVYRAVQTIEDKFDRRHEDNIERFAKLETKLDIVIKNGH